MLLGELQVIAIAELHIRKKYLRIYSRELWEKFDWMRNSVEVVRMLFKVTRFLGNGCKPWLTGDLVNLSSIPVTSNGVSRLSIFH